MSGAWRRQPRTHAGPVPGHSVLQLPVAPLEAWVRARTAHYDRGFVSVDPTFGHAHITALGPFDPSIELMSEDLDLCLRAAARGIPRLFAPDLCSLVHHGASARARRFEDAGLALANQGDVNPQSVAGSMATGTHGTGVALGSLSTFARGFRLVLVKEPVSGDGRMLWKQEFREAMDRVGAEFGVAVVDPTPALMAAGGAEMFQDEAAGVL